MYSQHWEQNSKLIPTKNFIKNLWKILDKEILGKSCLWKMFLMKIKENLKNIKEKLGDFGRNFEKIPRNP